MEHKDSKLHPPPNFKTNKNLVKLLLLNILALVISLIAIIGCGITWYSVVDKNVIKRFQGQLDDVKEQQTHLQQLLATQNKENAQQHNNLQNLEQQIDQLQHASQKEESKRSLNEVIYLLQTANLRLILTKDVASALSLLELAQDKVKEITYPNLLDLKNSINQDIANLQTIPSVDLTDIIFKLSQLREAILQLKTIPSLPILTQKSGAMNQESNSKKTWQQRFAQNLTSLKNLVIIRHHTKPIKPLLSSQEHALLIGNIELTISQAQWAVLQHNAKVFALSLRQIRHWLEEDYPEQAGRETAIKILEQLATMNINPSLPTLNRSLNIAQLSLNNVMTQSIKSMPPEMMTSPAVSIPSPSTNPEPDRLPLPKADEHQENSNETDSGKPKSTAPEKNVPPPHPPSNSIPNSGVEI